jgi:hypothetical protein
MRKKKKSTQRGEEKRGRTAFYTGRGKATKKGKGGEGEGAVQAARLVIIRTTSPGTRMIV